jgi:hypothetical protein
MTLPVDPPIGQLIRTADAGDGAAADQLFSALYRELHAIAEREVHRQGTDLTADEPALSDELEQLDTALETQARVDLELAELRGVSDRTVQRDWRKARLLLHRTLQEA